MSYSYTLMGMSWACLSAVIYFSVSTLLINRNNAAKARKLDCKEPIIEKNRFPGAIDRIWHTLKADKKGLVLDFVSKRFQNLGTLTFQASVLGTSTIFTADEKNIQAILATQFEDFDLGPNRWGTVYPLLGNGIFSSDGKPWQHYRAMLRPQFARDQVSDLELEERHVQNLLRVLAPQAGCWTKQVNLQELFFRLTLDTATEFLFGYSVNSQLDDVTGFTTPKPKDVVVDEKAFAVAFDKANSTIASRLRLKDKYWMLHPRSFTDACTTCHGFIDNFVRLALANEVEGKSAGITQKDEKYVFLTALVAETKDPIEIRSQLLQILLAGRDTTASLLGWLFFSLARDPTRYSKLRDIVLRDFGTYDSPSNITFNTLKACKYLHYCLNEALRLYPVVPVNFRQANRDTTLPRGGGPDGKSKIFIPKGMQVDYSVYVMHHRAEIWGEDVEDFVPERWEAKKIGWEFLPFNGGPRICIGQQFALTEASYVTVRLLQKFDGLQNLETDPVTRHKLGLTTSSANGVNVTLRAS